MDLHRIQLENAIASDIPNIDENFRTLGTAIDSAASDATTAQTTANEAKTAAAAAQTTANEAKTAIDNIEITADAFSGVLPVSKGGTGASNVTSGYFLTGNGTGALTQNTPLLTSTKLGLGYGTCTTAETTAEKLGTLANFVRRTGAEVSLMFSYANTAASPTLNVNGTGEAAIYNALTGTYITESDITAGMVANFVFNGTQWVLLNPAPTATMPSFVYECTGTADSTAIADIVNDFFTNGTAMSMKLTVTGTMGIEFTETYYAMYINATNTRDAVCHLDFSDCNVPVITTATRDFLYIGGSVNLSVTGLVCTATRYGALCISTGINHFVNCKISGGSFAGVRCMGTGSNHFVNCKISSSSSSGVSCIGTSTNNFVNCMISGSSSGSGSYGVSFDTTFAGVLNLSNSKITGTIYGVYSLTANTTAVIKLTDCLISGGTYAVYQDTAASTMHWLIKGCSFNTASIYVNGATIAVSSTVANAYLAIQAYHNLFSQTIS